VFLSPVSGSRYLMIGGSSISIGIDFLVLNGGKNTSYSKVLGALRGLSDALGT
jgi:uncharacterized protein YrrD